MNRGIVTSTRLAWIPWALLLALTAVHLGLLVLNRETEARESLAGRAGTATVLLALATCAALVTSRRPRNPIGWLLYTSAASLAVYNLCYEYAILAIRGDPGSLSGGTFAAWVQAWVWVPFLAMVMPGLALFPDGELPSPRWRPVLWLSLASLALGTVGAATAPGPLLDEAYVENPLGVEVAEPAAEPAVLVTLVVLLGASALAPIVRYRRAGLVERQQLKWLAFSGLVLAVVFPAVVILDSASGIVRESSSAIYLLALLSFPLSITIAMLRYGLYDIDRIINRTLVYGSLTVALGAAYAGLVVGLQALFRPFTGGSELAITITTLAVAAAFQPARRRIQDAVDRRFNRRRYDAGRTLEAFSGRLRDEVDLEALRRELLAVVGKTMEPAHVSLWLKGAEAPR